MGKSKLAAALGQSLGMSVFNVGEFAKEKNCLGNWDPEYESHELDEDPLLDLLEEKVGKGDDGFVLEHYVPDLFHERWFDLVVVLMCDNIVLYDRLMQRGYGGKKLEENCQIFQDHT